MSDIKQHPLWREHHGDMTGFEYLDPVKDTRTEGDECINNSYDIATWHPIAKNKIGEPYSSLHYVGMSYRRRIAPATDQKRFVTVVIEVDAKTIPDDFTALGKELGIKIESIREGNYLEKFDGMKERVNNAMEDAK